MTDYTVQPGQPASNGIFAGGDTLTVSAGGYASNELVGPGGSETVYGTAEYGSVSGTVVSAGQQATASMTVETGGFAEFVDVVSGASLVVFGTAEFPLISGVTTATEDGLTTIDLTSAIIMSGGSLLDAVIGSGADVAVDGMAAGGTVEAGGVLDVFGQGNGVTVRSGGSLNVALGGTDGTSLQGGTQTVYGTDGGGVIVASATAIYAGGLELLVNGGVDRATTIYAGGREFVGSNALSLDPEIMSGGVLELGSQGGATGIVFSSAGGRLLIDGELPPGGVISGFAPGDEIVFAALPADAAAHLSIGGSTVRISADSVSEVLNIAGASTMDLQLGTDPATGSETLGIACYRAGTAILTEHGEAAVETIAAGDRVVTADGRVEPVMWVGRRSYAGRLLAGQQGLMPVRFQAGSLGGGVPRRDLLVSPRHAMLLDGVLVEAASLVNGTTVRQEKTERIDYVHLELARHDVILAEGSPSETYLDDNNRMMFANACTYRGSGTEVGRYCAPRLADGYEVEQIRRRLAGLVAQAA